PPAVRAECDVPDPIAMTDECPGLLPGRQVPDPHGLIGAPRGEEPAAGAVGDTNQMAGMAGEVRDQSARGQIPDLHASLAPAGRRDLSPVGAEREGPDPTEEGPGTPQTFTRLDIPDP